MITSAAIITAIIALMILVELRNASYHRSLKESDQCQGIKQTVDDGTYMVCSPECIPCKNITKNL